MNREIRQQTILNLVEQKQTLTIAEIRKLLQVSAMTLHRDLRDLEEKKLIRRVHGGVVSGKMSFPVQFESCAHCGGELPVRTRITLIDQHGKKSQVCCCHCGFGLMRHEEYSSALGVDFLYGTVVDLKHSLFLVKPQVKICCEPSVLLFADEEDALRMQKGFGGVIMNYEGVRHLMVNGLS
ncbi:MAG: DeoR family transcriptional regulator [Bellilinea sp.]|nr:DeoR family transcriptional regulator [Bellilinea sp.]